MSKILANEIANYGDNAPIEVKEGINIPADKPLQADGISGTSGQVLTSTGSSVEWTTPFDGNYNSLTNLPTIPAAQVRADWNAVGTVSEILNKPVVPAQPTVSVDTPSANGNLTYNQSNGLFTFTPPDLSPYALATSVANAANWDAAYSWGDHSLIGYLTSESDPQFNSWYSSNGISGVTQTTINEWNTAYGWGDHSAVGYLTTGLQDLVDDTTPQLGGDLDLNGKNITGTGTISSTGFNSSANSLTLGSSSSVFTINFSQVSGSSPQIRNDFSNTGIGIWGAYNSGSTYEQDVHLGTSGNPSWFKHIEPETNSAYDLGKTTRKWANLYVDNIHLSGTIDINIEDLQNVDVGGGLSDQQVLKWDAASSSWKPANDLVGGQSAIELADLSVSNNPASGGGTLSYNNTNGVFTYTPPDLSANLLDSDFTSSGLMTTDGLGSYSITSNNSSNWDTAYSWGDHGAVGYLTSFTETDPVFSAHVASNILQQNINNWNTAYSWGDHGASGYATTTQLNTAVANSSNWDTAYSWGDHSIVGYLTSLGDAAGVTSAKITNWDTAYSWGDHSTVGYLTSVTASDFANVSIDAFSDVDTTTTAPTNGQTLLWDGGTSTWKPGTFLGGNANVIISDTAPGSVSNGDLWWESDKGRLKIYYQDVDSAQWVDASPPLAQPNVPVAAGFITLNGTSPTWTGTTGYTVSGAQPGGAGTDYEITLSFPSAYSARTDYIVQATYDGTNYIGANGASIGVSRGTNSVVFTPRRWDENPLSTGEIMITITNL